MLAQLLGDAGFEWICNLAWRPVNLVTIDRKDAMRIYDIDCIIYTQILYVYALHIHDTHTIYYIILYYIITILCTLYYVKLYYIIVSVNKVRVHLRNETVPAVQQICREEVAL